MPFKLNNNIKKTLEKFIYILVVILILIGLSKPVLMYGAVLLSIAFLVFSKTMTDRLSFMIFLLPFSQVFVKGVVGGLPYYNYLMLILIILYFIKNRKISAKVFVSTGICVVYVGLLAMDGMRIPLRGQFTLIGIVLVTCCALTKEEFDGMKMARAYACGILLSVVVALCKDYIPNLSHYMNTEVLSHEIVSRFCGLVRNPNYYTLDITIAIAGLLYVNLKDKRYYIQNIIFIILLSASGFMAVSMSFVFSLVIMGGVYIIIVRNKKINIKNTIIVVALLVIAARLLINVPSVQAIFTRLDFMNETGGDISSITTKRSDIWVEFLKQSFSSARTVIFGFGLNSTFRSAHNFYIETLYYYGLIGVCFFINWFFCIYKYIRKKKLKIKMNREHWTWGLLLLVPLLFRAFGISLISYMNFWMILCFIIVLYQYDESNKNNIRIGGKNDSIDFVL